MMPAIAPARPDDERVREPTAELVELFKACQAVVTGVCRGRASSVGQPHQRWPTANAANSE